MQASRAFPLVLVPEDGRKDLYHTRWANQNFGLPFFIAIFNTRSPHPVWASGINLDFQLVESLYYMYSVRGEKLDNEYILKQFEEIEQKVDKLIDVCKSLETTNSELRNKVKRLEGELQGKVEAESNFEKERALVRSKIDGLLARMRDITEVE